MTVLPEWLGQRANLTPERLALVFGAEQRTFAGLEREVERTARALSGLAIRPGECVAVLMGNSPAFVELVHALPRLGAVLLPLNTRLAPAELAWQLGDAGARYLIHDRVNEESGAAAVSGEPGTVAIAWEEVERGKDAAGYGGAPLLEDIDLEAIHTIIYTSGTTGRPKGATLTYGNHWWSATGSALNLGLHHDDRWLAPLPLFHVGGLSILLKSVIYGIPALLHPSFDPLAVNRAIDEDGVTIVSVVATMLRRMLDARGDRAYPPTLRCVLLGGGPAPRPLLEACAERGVPVVQTYGLTEAASQVATLAPEDALRKQGSAGKPLFPMQVRIQRGGVNLSPGEVGEIIIRGPTVMAGYVNGAERAPDDHFSTGDLGYLDEEGYLYVVDRRSDLIISGGENVYPAEVEAVLLAHPAVDEAGVVGVPDEHWGQQVVAAVTLQAGQHASVEELVEFCRGRLARYKVPARVRFVDSLPRNAAGKPVRRALREIVGE